MMTRRPKAILSSKNYKFGAEKVIISTQTYRDFCVSYIIELAIFGDSFKYLHTGEIIAQTKKQVLIHIASKKKDEGAVYKRSAGCF